MVRAWTRARAHGIYKWQWREPNYKFMLFLNISKLMLFQSDDKKNTHTQNRQQLKQKRVSTINTQKTTEHVDEARILIFRERAHLFFDLFSSNDEIFICIYSCQTITRKIISIFILWSVVIWITKKKKKMSLHAVSIICPIQSMFRIERESITTTISSKHQQQTDRWDFEWSMFSVPIFWHSIRVNSMNGEFTARNSFDLWLLNLLIS